jgi:ornithine cyclodeaminase/alanine dehydrogenase-like protein (mu-crystallin family)
MQQIDAEATRAALPFAQLVPALAEAFASGCVVPPRHHHTIAAAGGDATLLLMPAWMPDRFFGIKIVNIFPGNRARGIPAVSGSYVLCDGGTGQHLALIDGGELTARRTAAVSALGASFLSRPDAQRMLVVGAGRVASLLPEAYRVVRPIGRVEVWNVTRAHGEALAQRLRSAGFDAQAVGDLAVAAAAADIVSCATLATEPLLRGAWLRPGTHVDLIGSYAPHMREADDETVRRASVFVDTAAAVDDSGDLAQPIANGALRREDVRGALADLCRRDRPGRRSAAEITLFKSVGTAVADLAAAMLVHRAAAGAASSSG